MGLAALDIEPVGMGRDVAEQVVSMGRVSGLMRRRLERALAEALRLGKPTEPQTSATERMVGPAMMVDESPRRLMIEELLAFPQSVQRLARLVELRQCPGGGGDRTGKVEEDVSRPGHCDSVLEQ